MAFGVQRLEVVHLHLKETMADNTDRGHRVNAASHPIAHIGADADVRAPFSANLHYGFGAPVVERSLLIMIMEGQVNIIFVAEPLNGIQRFRGWFGEECLDAHFTGELEYFTTSLFVAGYDGVEAGQHAHARIVQLETNRLQFFIGQVSIEVLVNASAYFLKIQAVQISDTEFVRLLYGFKKRIFVKGITSVPTFLL